MGWDKKEPTEFIGASARLDAAARMREAARAGEDDFPTRQASQIIPATIVFVLAAGLALLAPEEFLSKIFSGGLTGIDFLDPLLAGAGPAKVTGDAEMNRLITVLLRGSALFLMAGAPPFLAAIIARLPGGHRVNPLVACWGALLALPLFYFLWGSF